MSVVVATESRTTVHPLPSRLGSNAFLVDAAGRLWLGQDAGEFGGRLAWMDLTSGRVTEQQVADGIAGFTQTAKGQLLAFGGLVHMGISKVFIAVIDPVTVQVRWQFESMGAASPDTPHPVYSIDRIIDDEIAGGFWVLSAHELYHASADFATWSRAVSLGGRFIGGRRLSLGNTPTISALLLEPATRDFITVSRLDGVRRTSREGIRTLNVDGQLDSPIVDIWSTSTAPCFWLQQGRFAQANASSGALNTAHGRHYPAVPTFYLVTNPMPGHRGQFLSEMMRTALSWSARAVGLLVQAHSSERTAAGT